MGINYASLLEFYRAEPQRAHTELSEQFRKKELRATDFDLGRLWAEHYGWHNYTYIRANRHASATKLMEQLDAGLPRVFQRSHDRETELREAAGASSTSSFQAISGQIVYNALLEGYDDPDFVFTKLIPVVQTEFPTERVAGISRIGPEGAVVNEGDPYPLVGVGEDYIDTAVTQKRGMIAPVTREAVFFDRTGQLLDRLRMIGGDYGYQKELRAINCVVDENLTTSAMLGGHRYHWRGVSIATYGNNSGTHTWDNLQASNGLTDYTDIENAEILLDNMADPNTAVISGKYRAAAKHIVVSTSNLHTLKQILGPETLIGLHAGGYATSGNLYERVSKNTLQSYQIVSSPLVAAQLATDSHWFLGNIEKACRYMQNWPIETTSMGASSHDEFHRDIVQQFKVSERGAYTTFDPRFLIQSTA